MKILCVLFFLIAGCSSHYNSHAIKDQTEDSINKFAIVNKTTNADVLKKFKKPIYKSEYSDGRYSYTYSYVEENKINMFNYFAKNDDMTTKSIVFIFSKDNLLEKIHFLHSNILLRQRSKYDNLKYQMGGGGNSGKISLEQFNCMEIGTTKARLMSTYGMPAGAADDEDDEDLECWTYAATEGFYTIYYLDIKNNKLFKKYIIKYGTELNGAEKNILKETKE